MSDEQYIIPKPILPNAETIAAIEAAGRGEIVTVHSTQELFESLNDEDGYKGTF